ncbi:MAG: hypothetical protein IKR61_04275 [Lachnospiraceae bacterium]|nr:hypothetical protein [Lachnospiraceae bacterium]
MDGSKRMRRGKSMGFWKYLFKRARQPEPENDDWEEVTISHRSVDFHDQEQRSRYITNCLEQMAEASHEAELLQGEYNTVTSYLTDIEEIEALPDLQKSELESAARQLVGLESEMQRFQERKNRLTDAEFYSIRRQEDEIEEGIAKLRENEEAAVRIKKDLRRLDAERHACSYRREELEGQMNNARGMVTIFLTAFAALMVLLLVLQFGMQMNVFVGYLLAFGALAAAMTVVYVKYTDAEKELQKVTRESGKLISLQNTVKIRYVNNRKLLEYLYLKYNVSSGEKLEKMWKVYLQEREERRQYTEAQAKADYYQKQLITLLVGYHVRTPERWLHQVQAILDRREMVEIRHGLILRRQSLREQMEYNKKLATEASEEVKAVAREYPMYAREILEMTNAYEKAT